MLEVANAGEYHREIVLIGCGNDFGIANRSAGLNDSGDAMFCSFIDAISKRKESVRCEHRALDWEWCAHSAKLHGIDARHLASADTNRLTLACIYDRVRLRMFTNSPGKQQRANLFFGGCTFADYCQIVSVE